MLLKQSRHNTRIYVKPEEVVSFPGYCLRSVKCPSPIDTAMVISWTGNMRTYYKSKSLHKNVQRYFEVVSRLTGNNEIPVYLLTHKMTLLDKRITQENYKDYVETVIAPSGIVTGLAYVNEMFSHFNGTTFICYLQDGRQYDGRQYTRTLEQKGDKIYLLSICLNQIVDMATAQYMEYPNINTIPSYQISNVDAKDKITQIKTHYMNWIDIFEVRQ